MSAFGFFEKDEVVSAIDMLCKAEHNRGSSPREIIKSVMEAVTYGLDNAMFELRDVKVDDKN